MCVPFVYTVIKCVPFFFNMYIVFASLHLFFKCDSSEMRGNSLLLFIILVIILILIFVLLLLCIEIGFRDYSSSRLKRVGRMRRSTSENLGQISSRGRKMPSSS